MSDTTSERHAQKARTREALLAGARALLAEGGTVSVTAAARRAGISKATAYRYFSDPAVLAAEAGLAVQVKPYDEIVAGATTPRARVHAVSLYILNLSLAHEAAFRQFLARSLDAIAADADAPTGRRGARRVEMFRRALAPERQRLGPEAHDRLVRALSTATGTEAMIALLDVAGTDRDGAETAVGDMTDAVLDRFLGAEDAAPVGCVDDPETAGSTHDG
jgi:AcrR family transcriptional regulator